MSSPEVMPEQPVSSTSCQSETNEDDDEFSTHDEDITIAKLPGTALLRSVQKTPKNSSNESFKFKSDHTYDCDEGADDDNTDEFGEDLADSTVPGDKKNVGTTPSNLPTEKVPAWKLRQQMRAGAPPPPKTIIDSESKDKSSPLRGLRKTTTTKPNNVDRQDDQNWFKKLTAKKETPEEKEKRIKNEALIDKQTPSRWGKDILEEDDYENAKDPSKKKVADLDDGDEKEGDEPPKSPMARNRWAMMGSAAMTSMRNVQRGLMGGGDDEDDKKTETETVPEEENDEDGDKVSEMNPDQNRRQAMWRNKGAAAFSSVRNAWGGGAERRRKELMNGDESSSHADDGLDKSFRSDPGDQASLSDSDKLRKYNQNVLSHLGNFLNHTKARFDPEVWNDPEIKETLLEMEKLRRKINEGRHKHKNETRRRQRQIENAITQQKNFLARKLGRQMYNYRSNPFHPCIKEVYEQEILIIVHEVTSLGVDDDSEKPKDGIDHLLDSERFDYDYNQDSDEEQNENEGQDTLGAFFGKQKKPEKKQGDNSSVDGSMFSVDGSTVDPTGRNSVIPHQTRLIRAQHNEWMMDNQMKLVRSFQQKSMEEWYDVLPEQRKEHDKLKAIPKSALEAKIKEMEEYNKNLREAYQARVDAQEKLLAIYRERYVPSVHEDEDENGDGVSGEEEDKFNSSPSSAKKGPPKRPSLWAKNLGQSVRGLLKKEGNEDEADGDASQGSKNGFDLLSPITSGSQRFLMMFGSPENSKIPANLSAQLPLSSPKSDEHADKQSQQDSAKDSAAAAWTVPEMDKGSLPESLAEKRDKRAAARRAARPDATSDATRKTTATASASRSELLQRARKARQESAAAQGTGNSGFSPTSPTPSSRAGRNTLRSNTASPRKELSMKDLSKTSPLSSPVPGVASSRAASQLSEARRLRIMKELQEDEGLALSSHHSLHERKPMGQSLKATSDKKEAEDPVHEDHLQDVDEFGEDQ